jgi:hypothetical protein
MTMNNIYRPIYPSNNLPSEPIEELNKVQLLRNHQKGYKKAVNKSPPKKQAPIPFNDY